MVFENNLLTAYEVVPAVQETIALLETLSEESADEQESFLHMFKIKDEDDLIKLLSLQISQKLDTSVVTK